jgi:ComF family protein
MKTISLFVSLVLEFLFPEGCRICGSILVSGESSFYGLCHSCREGFAVETVKRCEKCGKPLVSESGFCLSCRAIMEKKDETKTQMSYDRLISLFPYTGKWKKLLKAFKFGKSVPLGRFLSERLLEALVLLKPENGEKPVLVPVPPRPGKIRKTGWDQIESLAGILEKNREAPPVLRRLKRLKSETQKKLDRKRRQDNLRGRVFAKGNIPKICVLFDDVITTGSTMDACAKALKDSGAEKVYGICLFYD